MSKIYLVSFAFFLSSCSFIDTKKETQNLSLASKHCLKTGGENILIEKKSGVIGYCKMQNGQIINEWQKYRKDNLIP